MTGLGQINPDDVLLLTQIMAVNGDVPANVGGWYLSSGYAGSVFRHNGVVGEVHYEGDSAYVCVSGCATVSLPVMTPELARAVRTESVKAIQDHWGVRREIVYRWRRALGVPRMTAGTRRLWAEIAVTKLTDEVRRKGQQAQRAARRLR